MELFQSSKKLHGDSEDSSVAKLLRERSTIAASMKSINDVIRCALSAVIRYCARVVILLARWILAHTRYARFVHVHVHVQVFIHR